MQGKGISGPKIQDLAVTCLADFAETSLVNCGKIAAVSGGLALSEIASAAVHDRHRAMLESQLTRLMSILAQDCPIRYPTHLMHVHNDCVTPIDCVSGKPNHVCPVKPIDCTSGKPDYVCPIPGLCQL